ncbi:hypothetical protein AAON49_06205 [Pseudotenacibaculum sp. MALMAid0570]|uniref:hypothetical protein n=1 Tax=Pseudotenacibaculum sp. MALMAid0570 TaxID=3143938 RepID=UPI0032DF1A1E
MRYLFVLFIFVSFFSCQGKKQEGDVAVEKSEFSIPQKHKKTQSLHSKTLKEIDNWQEYEAVKDFLEKFHSISPNEALNNSKELNDLVKSFRDSIKPSFLESPAFNARVSLLHNETLRMYDMSSISSIKVNEVNLQVDKVLDAFSSINSKMNTIIKQIELDKDVNDPKFNKSLKKVDTVPLQTKEKTLKKQPMLKVDKKLKEKSLPLKKTKKDGFKKSN